MATGNPNLIPTIVLLGSFLVPVSFVVWAFGRRHSGEVTAELLFTTFITGGVLGVLAASLLESYLLHPSPLLFLGVGLIEEAAKLVVLAFLSRHLEHKYARDGLILGASVGFGFAAFESAGYAFTALFTEKGLSLMQLVQTELLRGVLAPVGHGLWTAILGGVLFSASGRRHFAFTGRLLVTYLGVSVLHALWDSMQLEGRVDSVRESWKPGAPLSIDFDVDNVAMTLPIEADEIWARYRDGAVEKSSKAPRMRVRFLPIRAVPAPTRTATRGATKALVTLTGVVVRACRRLRTIPSLLSWKSCW